VSETWQILEALLFASPEVVSTRKLANALDLTPSEVEACIAKLNRDYEQEKRSFHIRSVAGGWQMATLARFAPWIMRLLSRKSRSRLSKAALETLAVIAHRQPINKPDIDQARGIESSYMLSALLERGLIRIKGRDKRAGHPYVYATTPAFLEFFGLSSLDELPDLEEPSVKEEDIMPIEDEQEADENRDQSGEQENGNRKEMNSEALAAIGYRIEKEEGRKSQVEEPSARTDEES
jgi:segregation and condensation protein B